MASPLITLSDGNKIPQVGLGTWKADIGVVQNAVKYAILECGYRHIDCAYLYLNEDEVGKALKEVIESGEVKRSDLFITSKCWNAYHSRPKVKECLQKSLDRLKLDYLDLYLIHWPHGFAEGGEDMPIDPDTGNVKYSDVDYIETWRGMEDIHAEGLAKSIGLSNFNSKQIDRVLKEAKVKPVVNQVECHPYLNQESLKKFCADRGIVLVAYSPLGSASNCSEGQPILLKDKTIEAIAKKYNKQPAHILLRFNIQRGIVVIPKSVNPSRIKSNIELFDFELSPEDMQKICALDRNFRYVALLRDAKHPHYPFAIPF